MNTIERDELLKALYQVTTKGDLLSQFDSKLSGAKGSTTQRYTHLLEQIVFYSHAIVFGHGVQTAHNYRQSFMTTAKKNKLLKLSSKEIEKAFSFLNRTEKWDFLSDAEKIEVLKERQAKKPNERTEKQLQKIKSSKEQKQQNKDSSAVSNSCIAKDELNRFKAQLDTKSYELKKGQATGDKEAFIKIVLVTLSTGATQKDILEDIDLSDYKPQLIELNIRTIKRYIKEIRGHYDYIERAKELKEKVKRNPKNEDFKKELRRVEPLAKKQANGEDVDVSTGIRKAIRGLGVQNATNTRGLNALYRECLTSSTPK